MELTIPLDCQKKLANPVTLPLRSFPPITATAVELVGVIINLKKPKANASIPITITFFVNEKISNEKLYKLMNNRNVLLTPNDFIIYPARIVEKIPVNAVSEYIIPATYSFLTTPSKYL